MMCITSLGHPAFVRRVTVKNLLIVFLVYVNASLLVMAGAMFAKQAGLTEYKARANAEREWHESLKPAVEAKPDKSAEDSNRISLLTAQE